LKTKKSWIITCTRRTKIKS